MEYLNSIVPIDDDPRTSYMYIGDVSVGRFFLLMISTIIGLIFELVLSNINKTDKVDFKGIFNRKDIIISAIVSPVVFLTVYAFIRKQPDDVFACLLSFQNAFFWKSVLNLERLGLKIKE
jgi:hypothetical protein